MIRKTERDVTADSSDRASGAAGSTLTITHTTAAALRRAVGGRGLHTHTTAAALRRAGSTPPLRHCAVQ